MWWPGLTTDNETMVKQCHTCVKQTRHHKEPMIALDSPDYPWQRVGADLFELKRMNYLVVVDYFSCYFEVVKLTSTASCAVVEAMKNIFSRYGIPETLISDNDTAHPHPPTPSTLHTLILLHPIHCTPSSSYT